MKKTFALLLIVVFGFTTVAIAQNSSKGIHFIDEQNLDVAIKIAKEKNKIVFVDCYTTWCGPCKMLTTQTFPDSALGVFFNQNFVSVKLDMEAPGNKEIKKRYEVNVFPTLLFINSSGEIEHNTVGFMSPKELLNVGIIAMDPTKNSGGLKKIITSGNYTPEQLKSYLLLNMYNTLNSDLLKKYFEIQDPKVLFTAKEYEFIQELGGYKWNDVLLDFVWNNLEKYALVVDRKKIEEQFVNSLDNIVRSNKDKEGEIEKFAKYGIEYQQILKIRQEIRKQEKLVSGKLTDRQVWNQYFQLVSKNLKLDENSTYESSMRQFVYRTSQDSTEFTNVKAYLNVEKFDIGKNLIELLNLYRTYYLVRKNLKVDSNLLKELATEIKHYESKPSVMLNGIAWSFFETSNDKVTLEYALKIAEQSVKEDKNENNMDTYALLHAKLGQFDSAIALENEALEFAQKNNNKKMIEVINKRIEKLQKAEVPGLK